MSGVERPVAAGFAGLGALRGSRNNRRSPRSARRPRRHRAVSRTMRSSSARWSNRVASRSSNKRQPMVDAGEPAAFATPPGRADRRSRWRRISRGSGERKRLMLSSSSRVSDAGSRVKPPSRSVVRWVVGVEAAHALDLVAEEIEPQRLALAPPGTGRRAPPRTANSPASATVSVRDIAVGLEQRGEPVEVDPLAGREPRDELADAERRQRALGGGVDGGDEELRLVAPCAAARGGWRAAPTWTRSDGELRS